jgi:hypothetical protein
VHVEDTSVAFESSTPEHYALADGSVIEADHPHAAHDSLDDWLSDLGEAAHERLIQDFHAGDSGFRDPGSDYREAHEQRRQLRALDHAQRPSLSDGAGAPGQIDADQSPDLGL